MAGYRHYSGFSVKFSSRAFGADYYKVYDRANNAEYEVSFNRPGFPAIYSSSFMDSGVPGNIVAAINEFIADEERQ